MSELESFAQAPRTRRDEAQTFFRNSGVSRESWYLQDTGQGRWVIAVTVLGATAPAA